MCKCEEKTETCACCGNKVAPHQFCDTCKWQDDPDLDELPDGLQWSSVNEHVLELYRIEVGEGGPELCD